MHDAATDEPLWAFFAGQPNEWQTWPEWIETTLMHAVLCGDGISFINRPNPRGPISERIGIALSGLDATAQTPALALLASDLDVGEAVPLQPAKLADAARHEVLLGRVVEFRRVECCCCVSVMRQISKRTPASFSSSILAATCGSCFAAMRSRFTPGPCITTRRSKAPRVRTLRWLATFVRNCR